MAKEKFPLPKGFTDPRNFPWNPATEEELRTVEVALGVRFPEDYREFLKTRNGFEANAHPPVAIPTYNPYVEAEEPFLFNTIYTISKDPEAAHAELLADQDAYHFKTRVPSRFMIIGRTLGMDRVCMSLSGPDRGKIYHWYPVEVESWADVERNSEQYLFPLANSFSEFWSKLYKEDDP